MKARGRGVSFRENDMPRDVKAGLAPRFHKAVRLVPGVKRNAELFVFQNPMHLREGRIDPAVVVVVLHGASRAIAVPDQVRRISDDEIDRAGGHPLHHVHAVALRDAVQHLRHTQGHGARGPCFCDCAACACWRRRSLASSGLLPKLALFDFGAVLVFRAVGPEPGHDLAGTDLDCRAVALFANPDLDPTFCFSVGIEMAGKCHARGTPGQK